MSQTIETTLWELVNAVRQTPTEDITDEIATGDAVKEAHKKIIARILDVLSGGTQL